MVSGVKNRVNDHLMGKRRLEQKTKDSWRDEVVLTEETPKEACSEMSDHSTTPPHGGTIMSGVIPFEKDIQLFSVGWFSLSMLMFLLPPCSHALLYFPGLSHRQQLPARTWWPVVFIKGLGTPH